MLVEIEGSNSGRTLYETGDTVNYDNNQLLVQQDRILQEQDRGIETLSHIIQNQKRIATTIGNEVDRQNGILKQYFLKVKLYYKKNMNVYLFKLFLVMIEGMGDNIDQIHDRLVNETKRMRIFSKKTGTCGIE